MNTDLKDILKLFLKLGFTAFGGPAAHIALMQKEVVEQKKWLTNDHFLDLISATNLIPGPNSTEMTMHCGHEKAGTKGLIIAGVSFILPAVLITAIIAWTYKTYGSLPQVTQFIYGIKPAIIAIIISAIIPLAKASFKNYKLYAFGIVAICLCIAGINEILVLFSIGFVNILISSINRHSQQLNSFFPLAALPLTNLKLFFTFLKIGAILYGSGYVLFSFLDAELVETGIISKQVLIDAIAVGQFTPGPVFSSATFIGWQIGDLPGAIAATLGIFLPSFIFVALLNPLIPKMRASVKLSAFLDAVNVASVAIIVFTCYTMFKESVTDWKGLCIFLVSACITFFFKKVNSALIVLIGSLLGYILYNIY